jgi:NTE family protein
MTTSLASRPPTVAPVTPLPRRGAAASRTAFVLSGGASLGAAHAGMLQALYERGIAPDLIVATSAGALNAAYVASRPQTPATAQELSHVWVGLHRDSVFPINARTVIGGLANVRNHLVPDRGLRALIARHLQFDRLEEARIPLHLIAFDLLSGSEARLSRGDAMTAVLAATAIPGVLPPVPSDDRLLVDGGVVNNTPISHAVELGADRVFVLTTDDPNARAIPAPPRGALDAAVHAFTLLISTRLDADLRRYAGEVELIVLSASNAHRVLPTDFDHAANLIAASRASSRSVLAAAGIGATLAA